MRPSALRACVSISPPFRSPPLVTLLERHRSSLQHEASYRRQVARQSSGVRDILVGELAAISAYLRTLES